MLSRDAAAWIVIAGCAAALMGCGLQKKAPTARVLKTEEFISDPTTVPAETTDQVLAAAPGSAPGAMIATPVPDVVSAAAASEGVFDVSAAVGRPEDLGPAPKTAALPLIVDAKIGEMNGRPVRVDDVMDEVGQRLAASARSHRFSREEWALLIFPQEPTPEMENREIRREDWLRFAEKLIDLWLNEQLEQQLLAEEARASLKPEQRQGLKYLVEQATQEERRKVGGSEAEFQRQLREQNMTQRDWEQRRESVMLIGYQLEEKLRKKISTSWKDVRLYYERNSQIYNPPPVAKFRMIQVPLDKPGDIAEVQSLLDKGEPFAMVAQLPVNGYGAKEGGRVPDRKFEGEYAEAKFFPDELNAAVVRLHAGGFTTPPVDFNGRKTWVFLETIERRNLPLSDPDVQLSIASRLNNTAFAAERKAYIQRLKSRATYTDIDVMKVRLAEIAGQRYWPKE